LTHSRELARDARNEAFMRAIANWETVGQLPIRKQRAWLVKAAKNWAYDQFRRDKQDRAKYQRYARHHPTSTRDGELSSVVSSVVRDALQSLPPRDREVLVLRYITDLDISEITEVLGISKTAVTTRLDRARRRLRRRLPPELAPRLPTQEGGALDGR
jgi:RNA polymerase sigma-70 factor (ECF subfamily)